MGELNRTDIGYTVISRFEQTMRSFFSFKISNIFANFSFAVPESIVRIAKERSEYNIESIDDLLDNIDFIHLKEIAIYKGNYEHYFDENILDRNRFIRIMDDLYEYRCKISHVRGYFTSSDLNNLIDYTNDISNNLGVYGVEFGDFLKKLYEFPNEYIIKPPIEFNCDIISIPNNIPTPDYEYEGGFIGRKDDIAKIISMLEGDLHRVITIAGAGGVGKTALALKIIHDLVRKSTNVFDGVVWLSAKENKLTYLGIEDIEPTVKNYEELLDTILSVMGYPPRDVSLSEKVNEVNELFNIHTKVLIVVDNLETITDDNILDFIVDAHPKIKILITSRKGLGQVERRYDLKELKEREAIQLFRSIARDKNLDSLASLSDDIIKIYVNKLSRYPLAIKWLIGHVKIGRDINLIIDTIHEQHSDISQFCFDKIYNEISENSKIILCALSMIDEPPSAGLLKYVAKLDQFEFEDSVRELTLLSLVIPEQRKSRDETIDTVYLLLPLTRGYVKSKSCINTTIRSDIDERLRAVKANTEEADRASKQFKQSLQYLGANTEEEKIAAMLAQTAFQKYQAGRYTDAVDDYKRAIAIAPKFGALYRNWSLMESFEGHFIESDQLMDKASKLSPNDPQIWLTWGNIKRKSDKIKEALPLLEKALKLIPDDPIVINVLGNVLCRLGNHFEAHNLYVKAKGLEDVLASKKHIIVNCSSMAENLKRWSENLIKDRDYTTAKDKLIEAYKIITEAYRYDKNDERTVAVRQSILKDLGLLYINYFNNKNDALLCLKDACNTYPNKYKGIRDSIICGIEVIKIYMSQNDIEAVTKIINSEFDKRVNKLRNDPDIKDKYDMLKLNIKNTAQAIEGRISFVNKMKKFILIESAVNKKETYIGHLSSILDILPSAPEDLEDTNVTFVPYASEYSPRTAISIRLVK